MEVLELALAKQDHLILEPSGVVLLVEVVLGLHVVSCNRHTQWPQRYSVPALTVKLAIRCFRTNRWPNGLRACHHKPHANKRYLANGLLEGTDDSGRLLVLEP